MGRTKTKTPGIQRTGARYDVDKLHRGERLRRRGFEDFASAEEWLNEEISRINKKEVVTKRKVRTFMEAATRYLDKNTDKLSAESEVYHLKAVLPYIGHLPLDQVYYGALEDFIETRKKGGEMMVMGKHGDIVKKLKKPCKNKTINLSLGTVRVVLGAATEWRDDNGRVWLEKAPVIKSLSLKDQRPARPITWGEQDRIMPLLPIHLREMSLFVLNTAVRDEVVCNLQWDWALYIDELDILVFVVPPEFVKGEEDKKTDMVLVCNSMARAVVERQRGKHEKYVFVYRRERVKNLDKAPVMPYRPIKAMNNSGWQTAREKTGLKDVRIQDLRHTAATRLREAGIEKATISSVMWHGKKTITDHYTMAQVRELYEALEKVTSPAHRSNVTIGSLIREAAERRLTQKVTQ